MDPEVLQAQAEMLAREAHESVRKVARESGVALAETETDGNVDKPFEELKPESREFAIAVYRDLLERGVVVVPDPDAGALGFTRGQLTGEA